jgi:hypothetical protein
MLDTRCSWRRLGASLAAAALSVAIGAGTASADDPQLSQSGAATTGISIEPSGPRTPAELGYTDAYAAAKTARFSQDLLARA